MPARMAFSAIWLLAIACQINLAKADFGHLAIGTTAVLDVEARFQYWASLPIEIPHKSSQLFRAPRARELRRQGVLHLPSQLYRNQLFAIKLTLQSSAQAQRIQYRYTPAASARRLAHLEVTVPLSRWKDHAFHRQAFSNLELAVSEMAAFFESTSVIRPERFAKSQAADPVLALVISERLQALSNEEFIFRLRFSTELNKIRPGLGPELANRVHVFSILAEFERRIADDLKRTRVSVAQGLKREFPVRAAKSEWLRQKTDEILAKHYQERIWPRYQALPALLSAAGLNPESPEARLVRKYVSASGEHKLQNSGINITDFTDFLDTGDEVVIKHLGRWVMGADRKLKFIQSSIISVDTGSVFWRLWRVYQRDLARHKKPQGFIRLLVQCLRQGPLGLRTPFGDRVIPFETDESGESSPVLSGRTLRWAPLTSLVLLSGGSPLLQSILLPSVDGGAAQTGLAVTGLAFQVPAHTQIGSELAWSERFIAKLAVRHLRNREESAYSSLCMRLLVPADLNNSSREHAQ